MDSQSDDKQEYIQLAIEAARVFTPAAPINQTSLFAGRTEQTREVIQAVMQRGQHAMLYGERGVGKTSLANVLAEFLQDSGEQVLAPHVNCDGTDTFSGLWRKVFSEIEITRSRRGAGFTAELVPETRRLVDELPDEITPDVVRHTLTTLGSRGLLIVILDEFDRLPNGTTGRLFADTIKTLSDHSVPATILLVGVADSVDQLIHEHQSVERALMQIRMPRMSRAELNEIITNGLSRLSMEMDEQAIGLICQLARGLPHYTHLLALNACYDALDEKTRHVSLNNVFKAMRKAISNAQQTIISAYHSATMSPRPENLYQQVLLACALAPCDDLGYFAAADVREPMSRIMAKPCDIPTFAKHLHDFCETGRGPILQKIGGKHRYRFRFSNPLMQPYVIMQGLATGLVTPDVVSQSTQ